MVVLAQHLQDAARDALLALDRLVGVGVDAQRDGLAAVRGASQGLAQLFGRVGLGEQPGFEVEPRRQVEVGVRGPRKAVDAAVLAAAVRVQRDVERNIRRRVARQD
ncbi:hypothetical protein D3C72_1119030 [compost metagenome]